MFRARQVMNVALAIAAAVLPAAGPQRMWVAAGLFFLVLPYNVVLERRMRRTGVLREAFIVSDVALGALFPLAVADVWVPALLISLCSLALGAVALGPTAATKAAVLSSLCFAAVAAVVDPVAGVLGATTYAIAAPTIVFTVGRVSAQERRGRSRYGDLVTGIDAIVWESGALEPGFWYVSRQAETMLGYPVEAWYEDPYFWSNHLHPDDREETVAHTRAAMAAGRDHDLEYRMIAADGRTVWLRELVRMTCDETGQALQAKGVMVDVTAHKDAEAKVGLYVDVVERMPVALFIFRLDDPDDDGSLRLVTVNPAAAALVAEDGRHLLDLRIDEVLPDMATQGLPPLLAEVVRTGVAYSAESYPFVDHRTRPGVFALDAFPLPDGCVGVSFDDVTARSAIEDALRHQAMHDALTGLPNRTLLVDRLQRALVESQRRSDQVALLIMDLDQFKEINDTLGHPHGDALLELLGRRLTGVVRESDTIARLGGDEFAVLLTAAGPDTAVAVAHKIMSALQQPFVLDGLAIQTHTSIGIAVSPDHGADVPTLMQRADVAMYDAKRSGSGYAVYTVEHDNHSVRRLTLSSELRRALDDDELVLHFQPKLDVPTGDVVGVECLIRWQHPEHGLLGPEEFIGLAEVSGLIRPLTRWVIHEAARQCRAWADGGVHLSMAVNISVRNLYDAGLGEYIRHVLDVHALPAERLILEITESEVMEDPMLAMEVLGRIGAMGVVLSIDDFGTGYSSLSYLKQLPIDEIKIDRSFVAGLATSDHDAVIVRAIIDLGHNLGRLVTAEGVEDAATWNRLIELGCDRAQGYLLGRPMTPDRIVEWMATAPQVVH